MTFGVLFDKLGLKEKQMKKSSGWAKFLVIALIGLAVLYILRINAIQKAEIDMQNEVIRIISEKNEVLNQRVRDLEAPEKIQLLNQKVKKLREAIRAK